MGTSGKGRGKGEVVEPYHERKPLSGGEDERLAVISTTKKSNKKDDMKAHHRGKPWRRSIIGKGTGKKKKNQPAPCRSKISRNKQTLYEGRGDCLKRGGGVNPEKVGELPETTSR